MLIFGGVRGGIPTILGDSGLMKILIKQVKSKLFISLFHLNMN